MRINHILLGSYITLLRTLPDDSVDLLLTDPPYGVNYQNPYTSKKHEVLDGDSDDFSYEDLASEAYRVLKLNSAAVAFTGWSVYPAHFVDFSSAGFKMKEPLVCQKRASGTTDLKGSFQTNADWMVFAHKGRFQFRQTELLRNVRAGTIPNKGRKPVPDFKKRFPSHWFGPEFPYATENPSTLKARGIFHPTVKGLQLIEWIIQLMTDPGAVVLDPFMGSGTTAVACIRTGRKFIGSEIKPRFHKLCLRRIREAEKGLGMMSKSIKVRRVK